MGRGELLVAVGQVERGQRRSGGRRRGQAIRRCHQDFHVGSGVGMWPSQEGRPVYGRMKLAARGGAGLAEEAPPVAGWGFRLHGFAERVCPLVAADCMIVRYEYEPV